MSPKTVIIMKQEQPPSPTHSESASYNSMADENMDSTHSGASENGYHNGETVSDTESMENSCDAPIDFSIKRKRKESTGSGSETGDSMYEESESKSTSTSPNLQKIGEAAALAAFQNGHHLTLEDLNKIGQPKPAIPGLFPGMHMHPGLFPGLPAGMMPNLGMMGNLPLLAIDPLKVHENGSNGKNSRPFKAYPKDPLSLPLGYYGIPGMMPVPGMDPAMAQAMSMGTEELFEYYKKLQDSASKENHKAASAEDIQFAIKNEKANIISRHGTGKTSPLSPHYKLGIDSYSKSAEKDNMLDDPTTAIVLPRPISVPTRRGNTTSGNARKRPKTLPDEAKDSAYWDRRRKNNEAAKRSRDARRAKEDEIAIRAAFLEQENLKLRVEVAALKNETAKLRCMLCSS